MSESVIVHRRFCGPPNSANGGYVSGLVARAIPGPAEVVLRVPPPLDRSFSVTREGAHAFLRDGETVLAEAQPAEPDVTPPPSPGFDIAAQAEPKYMGHIHHGFPGCFVCGTTRAPGDGLRIFCAPVGDGDFAAAWTPTPDLAGPDGRVADEFLWAALDCPCYWALPRAGTFSALLGRFTVALDARPKPGDKLVLASWPIEIVGRKHRAASALYDEQGRVLARADSLWIERKKV